MCTGTSLLHDVVFCRSPEEQHVFIPVEEEGRQSGQLSIPPSTSFVNYIKRATVANYVKKMSRSCETKLKGFIIDSNMKVSIHVASTCTVFNLISLQYI